MSDNSSCSLDSNTFQMYQDFDILFGDPIPKRDRWDHSWIDWDVHVEKLCHEQHFNFIYFGVVAPGSMNNIIAITETDNLMDKIWKLALGRFLVGDAAYELTEHLLTPYTGSQ